jgi:hypothetical protein
MEKEVSGAGPEDQGNWPRDIYFQSQEGATMKRNRRIHGKLLTEAQEIAGPVSPQ